MKPLVIDLFCGLGGWTKGFLEAGYDAVGFDIEHHQYGDKRYPGQLVLQDARTLHGSQFRNAACIVASPPCQKYSYMAQPWDRAKREGRWQKWERDSPFGDFTLNELFDACFRLQREASEAAGRYIPMVVENVRGAQPWVGRAAWHYGSYYLWGDVPALMPYTIGKSSKVPGISWSGYGEPGYVAQGFNVIAAQRMRDSEKTVGHVNKRDGHSHTRHLTNQRESDSVKQPGHSGRAWLADPDVAGHFSSKSPARKAASAMIAEIPLELARWIAQCFKPERVAMPIRMSVGEAIHAQRLVK